MTRSGIVYELFFTNLPQQAFTAVDVVELYLHRFSGQDFVLQSDGTLRCPANQPLVAHERRREADGSLRVVYGASIRSCRPCPLREQCQWNGGATAKPRQVSVLLHPVVVGSAPLHRPGLESEGSSAGLLSPPSPPACRDPGRGWEWQGCCHTPCYSCAAFPC